MAKADSIIDALEKYFIGCELLKDGALRVDYLGEKPVEYTIEAVSYTHLTLPTNSLV